MRMAIVEIIGHLIRELASSPDIMADAHQTQKQLNGFYNLLLERTLDLSSYVRTKVFAVLARLCDLPVKFPKQRLAIARAAVGALEDKGAGVRKSAIALLVRLVVTHPYGLMHGGLLGLKEWENRYQTVAVELAKVEKTLGKAVGGDDDDGDEAGEGDDGGHGDKDEGQEDEEEDGEEDTDEDEEAKPKKLKKRQR